MADIVDTEGQAIRRNATQVNDEVVAEANATTDMFETMHFDNLEDTIAKDENARHEEVMREMREAIRRNESLSAAVETEKQEDKEKSSMPEEGEHMTEGSPELPSEGFSNKTVVEKRNETNEKNDKKVGESKLKSSIIELANNVDFSVATIEKQAKRIKERNEGEVFVSLH